VGAVAKKSTKGVSSWSGEDINAEIRKKARELYEKNGCKPGHDLDNWLKAEKIVKSKVCSF